MSKPMCYDHGEKAVYRNHNGYWFCPRCLDALFEWNQWIRKELVPASYQETMMERNKIIAEKHIQNAREFALRNPEIVDPFFLNKIRGFDTTVRKKE